MQANHAGQDDSDKELMRELTIGLKSSHDVMQALLDDHKANVSLLSQLQTQVKNIGDNVVVLLPLLTNVALLQQRMESLEQWKKEHDVRVGQSVTAKWQFWAAVISAVLSAGVAVYIALHSSPAKAALIGVQ